MRSIRGSLFVSGVLFLVFFTVILIGQLGYFNSHLNFYRQSIDLKEAQIMRNMAQTHRLKEKQELQFNKGKVIYQHSKYEIALNNGKRYLLDPCE